MQQIEYQTIFTHKDDEFVQHKETQTPLLNLKASTCTCIHLINCIKLVFKNLKWWCFICIIALIWVAYASHINAIIIIIKKKDIRVFAKNTIRYHS